MWALDTVASLPPTGLYGLAQAVRQGEAFPRDILLRIADSAKGADCRVETRESALLLRVRLVTSTRPVHLPDQHKDLVDLHDEAQRLLSCSPANSLAWFALFLATTRTDGFSPYALTLLSESYKNAPHEAWIQLIRLPVLLPVVDVLPSPLAAAAMADYANILDNGLDIFAAILISRAAPVLQLRLLDEVCRLSLPRRATLTRELTRQRPDRPILHRCLPDPTKPRHLR
jgi:hypothetical protein